jgi:hypothetical protein
MRQPMCRFDIAAANGRRDIRANGLVVAHKIKLEVLLQYTVGLPMVSDIPFIL